MIKFTKHLGFSPMLDGHHEKGFFDLQQGAFSNFKPSHSYYIEADELNGWKELLNCNLENLDKLKFSNKLKRRMVQALIDYYKLHLIHFKELTSHHILQTVFENE